MASRHLVRNAFRYLRQALRSPRTLQELKGTTSDILGRLATIEDVNIPFLKEIRRAQVINAAPVISERYAVQRRVLDVPEAPYPVFNPGLVQVGANYLSILRCSSLVNFRDGHFECATEQHNTTSYLLTIDADYQVIKRQLMDDSAVRGAGSPAAYGIEDVRLFLHEGKVWGIGAGIAPGGDRKLSVTQVAFEVEGTRIARLHVGPRPAGSTYEKNWVPVLADGKVWLNYSLDPTQFIEFRHGEFLMPEGLSLPASFELRNGTPFIPWGRGYMALAHSPPLWWNNRAHYLHHVVILDQQRRLVEVSSGFFLVKRGTEFACGLCRQGDKLVVSLGIADRYAVLLEMPVSAITDLVIATPD
jgi:predicted GH43/DUF377 family glycosyl hydrolase